MATSGTNITALAKPAVGVTAGPTWATDLNTSIDAVDGHDHSTNKGIRITPAAVNINADLEFNDNSATELKNVIFSTVTAATTSYSVYQASGNLYWRNGAGTAVQITTGSAVNAGSGSISGMTGNDSGVTYADGSKTFNFFTDSGNGDYGKMAHADLLLFKYSNDNSGDTAYITIAANSGVSGSSGTIYVPSENGTFLTTATSYAGAINIATSNSNNNIALKPHGTGFVQVGNAGATGKLTSNGAYDLILSTNSGTNSSTIAITDAANGSISFIPNGTGEIVIGSGAASGKITSSGAHDLVLDTNAGSASSSITITDAANGNINLVNNGTGEIVIGSGSASGKITSSGAHDLVLDTNAGTASGSITITDAANGNIALTNNGTGEIVIGSGSASGKMTTSGAHNLVLDTNAGSASSSITIIDATNGSILLNTNGTGEVQIGSGAASAKVTSNGAFDLVLDTNSGAYSGTVTITDGTNGNIDITPHGTGEVNLSKVDIDGGTIDATTVGAASHTTGKFTTCDATTDFTIGGLVITDNTITDDGTLSIVATTAITLDADTSLAAGHDLETSTTGKMKQRGAFMQSSTHQAMILGG